MVDVFEKIVELLRDGKTIAVASIVTASGSTPQRTGARMIVDEAGVSYFTVGGGGLEAAVKKNCVEAIAGGAGQIVEYNLAGEGGGAIEMACGGKTTVVIEVIRPLDKLVIFGAGHVGRALAGCAGDLGFAVSVVDDRREYLSPDVFPPGVRLILGPDDYDGELPALDANSYVVILTRSHVSDLRVLRYAVGKETAYLGMIGSARKVKGAFEKLREDGVSDGEIERIHAPVGLDIGSKTPKEIAISILAEIIKSRNQNGG
jgi:xanthine dehydrogenase accessory factor